MRWLGLVFALGIGALSRGTRAQVFSTVIGSPQACRGGIGLSISYNVQNRFSNHLQVPIVVEHGIVVGFDVFRATATTDPKAAVQGSHPDYITGPPPRKRRILKPGESMEWTSVFKVFTEDAEDAHPSLPPGDYFIWPEAEISVWAKHGEVPKDITAVNWIPIHVPRYEAVHYGRADLVRRCKW